jgi:hypothetical protein
MLPQDEDVRTATMCQWGTVLSVTARFHALKRAVGRQKKIATRVTHLVKLLIARGILPWVTALSKRTMV